MNMNKIYSMILMLLLFGAAASAQNREYVFTDAADLTLVGKLFGDTPNPYHRVDTDRFGGLTKRESELVRMSSGLACLFRTNSTSISVKTDYITPTWPLNSNGFCARGYDLYIRDNGQWLYAASGVQSDSRLGENLVLLENMPEGREYECLLYLPLYSELRSVRIGVLEGSRIEPMESPFRHRVAVFGSSFTHGSSSTRSGMSYPAQFTRETGIQLLSLGCSGNCKLQPAFCEILREAEDIDAFIFDAFSNPSARQIRERLFPFIERLQEAYPDVPLIFQSTIWREQRRYNTAKARQEEEKEQVADSLMRIACRRYKNVYFVHPNATSKSNDTSVDGVHPSNSGYTLWAESIRRPVLRILRKYGLK